MEDMETQEAARRVLHHFAEGTDALQDKLTYGCGPISVFLGSRFRSGALQRRADVLYAWLTRSPGDLPRGQSCHTATCRRMTAGEAEAVVHTLTDLCVEVTAGTSPRRGVTAQERQEQGDRLSVRR